MNSFLYIVVFCQLICISYWYHEISWKATNIRLFSIFRTFCETVYKFQTSCFDELIFFPRAGVLCWVKCDEGRFQVLCLQAGEGRKISEVQVRLYYYL